MLLSELLGASSPGCLCPCLDHCSARTGLGAALSLEREASVSCGKWDRTVGCRRVSLSLALWLLMFAFPRMQGPSSSAAQHSPQGARASQGRGLQRVHGHLWDSM